MHAVVRHSFWFFKRHALPLRPTPCEDRNSLLLPGCARNAFHGAPGTNSNKVILVCSSRRTCWGCSFSQVLIHAINGHGCVPFCTRGLRPFLFRSLDTPQVIQACIRARTLLTADRRQHERDGQRNRNDCPQKQASRNYQEPSHVFGERDS